MTIEQEFFKAFGIPKMGCSRDDNPCTYKSEKWNKCKNEGMECQENEFNYPPITPEIVLGLMKTIIKLRDNEQNTLLIIKNNKDNKYSWVLEENTEDYNNFTTEEEYNSLEDCILSLCIQLKDEIQAQVKELFNE